MTHAYWREGGPEFHNVNVMGVVHGTDKALVLAHKAAIDAHLAEAGITVGYTNVFWGGRSEIKPSEISPLAYEEFCRANGLDPELDARVSRACGGVVYARCAVRVREDRKPSAKPVRRERKPRPASAGIRRTCWCMPTARIFSR